MLSIYVSRIFILTAVLSFLLFQSEHLAATNALWVNSTTAAWDDNANWSPATFPNSGNDTAAFFSNPYSGREVTSTTDIRLGSLYIGPNLLNLTFNLQRLIFSGNLCCYSPLLIKNPVQIDTTFYILPNTTDITFSGPISSAGSSFYSDAFQVTFNASSNNTYYDTYIRLGQLILSSPDNTVAIPHDLFLEYGAELQVNGNNLISPNTTLTIKGKMSLNGVNVSALQLILSLKGLCVETLAPAQLTLLSGSPLIIGGNSELRLSQLTFTNPSTISYDNTFLATSLLSGVGTQNGIMQIVVDSSLTLDVPAGGNLSADLILEDVEVLNGAIEKRQSGILSFQGTKGSLTQLLISGGVVKIGPTAETVLKGEVITVDPSSRLSGFGKFDGLVVNAAGTVNPGDAGLIGNLTLRDYIQNADGILQIKGLNAIQSDKLVVTKEVVLGGSLFFEVLPGCVFNPGDQIVIVDNSDGTAPISGTFSSFHSNIPSNLVPTLVYHSQQVLIRFADVCSCPICPVCPSCPTCPTCPICPICPIYSLKNYLKW